MLGKGNKLKKNTRKESGSSRIKKKKGKGSIGGILKFIKSEKFKFISGLFLIIFSIYLLFAFISFLFNWHADDSLPHSFKSILFNSDVETHNWTGRLGAALAHQFIKEWLGISSFMIILCLFISGIKLLFHFALLPIGKTFRFSFIAIIWFSLSLGFIFKNTDFSTILGGTFGFQGTEWLNGALGKVGTAFLLFFILIGFLIIAYNLSIKNLILFFRNKFFPGPKETFADNVSENKKYNTFSDEKISNETPSHTTVEFDLDKNKLPDEDKNHLSKENFPKNEKISTDNIKLTIENPATNVEQNDILNGDNKESDETEHKTIDTPYDPTLDLSSYKYPVIELLNEYGSDTVPVNKEELETNKNRIVETLNNYSIQIDKIKATIGSTITLYEIVPAPGVRISKIKNLEDDIALSLAAMGIRIIAPIPGKGTIGIEVPNRNPETVSMRSIISSERFRNSNFELPFALGKTISNESYVADLTKMPHILMAGATGQGKSVGLNVIIGSLLYKKHPSQLKFVMVDPKKVELSLFSKIERHFLAKLPDSENAIITDTRQVVRTLNSLGLEMDARYNLLKDAQARNIKEYNVKFINRRLNPQNGHRYLPYIVLLIDEFADLIMTAGKEIETPLTRIAQLARAIGIHLIIATQRPSVNIITGTIKANFPARIAFRVTSKIDSRTILDSGGADQLVGRGDMLLSTGSDLIRLQCAFIDTPEVEKIAEYIGSQRGYPDAFHLPEYLDEDSEASKEFNPSERDELFEEAARIIVQHQHGSTSLLQRKLKLGYNRAGRIIDQLEAAGIVGHFEGSKAREVRIKDELTLEQFLNDQK